MRAVNMLLRLGALLVAAAAGLWLSAWNRCSYAPKVVAYRPGMTVCPGQTVQFPPVILAPMAPAAPDERAI
jgi:hypothetical protein